MRAAVLYESPGALHIEDVWIDDPGPNEVKVRVKATGLCHSDLHYLEHRYPLAGPMVLGHEAAGIVEAVGRDVSYVNPGDHVVAYSRASCRSCEWCSTGRPTLCLQTRLARDPSASPRLRVKDGRPAIQFTGLGTFAEQMLVHENSLVKISADTPFDRAALVGCAVPAGVGAVTKTADVRAGSTVAVIGCGGIGLNVIQGAALAGAGRIVAIDVNDGKLKMAKHFGASDAINNTDGNAREQLNDLIPGAGGVDYSFEAIGTAQTFELAFSLLRRGGTATVIGVGNEPFTLPMSGFLDERKIQGSVMGSMNYRTDLPHLLELYRQGRLKLDELVSRRISLDDINEGYAAIRDGAVARSVVVFED
jgi:S-(hydroxymethyl)glutathione dehydrogenase/alcohol dehydrogenase